MLDTKWSSFANQQAMITAATLVIGGLVSASGQLSLWPIGIYSLILGFFLFLIEYPRGRKTDSSTQRQSVKIRPHQHVLSELFLKLGHFYSNYFNRFIVYLILSVPCLFAVSTIIPGLNLLITSGLYLLGNFKKEKWVPIEKIDEKYQAGTVFKLPERPPPRDFNDL